MTNGQLWKSRWLTFLMMCADALGFSASWSIAYWVRDWLSRWMGGLNDFDAYYRLLPVVVVIGVVNCTAFGLYQHRRRLSSLNRWDALLRAGYHYLLYMIVAAYFFRELSIGRSIIFGGAALAFVYLWASRTWLRSMKTRAIAAGRGTVRAAIIGGGTLAVDVARSLKNHPEIGFTVVGIIRHPGEPEIPEEAGVQILGDTGGITQVIVEHQIDDVFLSVPHLSPTEQLNLINLAEVPGIRVQLVSNLFGVITHHAKVDEIGEFPVITLRDGYMPWHQALLKRTLDLLVGGLGTLVWLLAFHWWLSLLIRRDSQGPALFAQERVGKDGRMFRIWKYRTMFVGSPPYSLAPTDPADPRVTRFGAWLRKTSLDEMPQLLNVLRGEMSMVGPRPEMPFLVGQYQPWQRRRLDVKPGITGLWQVIGRKNLPLHLNMEYDFYYIKNQSFMLDIEILLRTIPAVLTGRGAF